ncbi:unnamed protein product, partial [Cuscuta epithymum]
MPRMKKVSKKVEKKDEEAMPKFDLGLDFNENVVEDREQDHGHEEVEEQDSERADVVDGMVEDDVELTQTDMFKDIDGTMNTQELVKEVDLIEKNMRSGMTAQEDRQEEQHDFQSIEEIGVLDTQQLCAQVDIICEQLLGNNNNVQGSEMDGEKDMQDR